jgi:tetratricopeptide (TPR) repeat protein
VTKLTRLFASVILAAGSIGIRGAALPAPAEDGRLEEAYRLNNLGVAQLEQYDYDSASATFAKALEAAPSLKLARINLAIALLHAGKLAEAEKAAEAAREADPRAPQPPYVLGLAARADNRAEAAAAAFEQVLALDPDDLGARVNLGQLYMQQRRYDEAATLFRAAVETEPYNATAAYNLGVALNRGGHAEEGERVMQRFQALRASGAATTFTNNYLERGRYAEAVAARGAEPDLVDRATPALSFVAKELGAPPAAAPATGPTRGAITLADIDRDGDLDLLVAGPEGAVLFSNAGSRFERATRQPAWPAGAATAILAADYDNDQLPDIAVATTGGLALLRQEPAGVFQDATTAAGITGVAAAAARALAFVDVDHDGDVDLLAAGAARPEPAASSSEVRLFRNNGNGTFADTTTAAGLDAQGADVAVVPTDFDNRRDVDLLFVSSEGSPRLMRNLRDATFAAVGDAAGLGAAGATAVAVGDVSKDGFADFFLASKTGGRFAMSDAGRRFGAGPTLPGAAGAVAALLVDYDNDGLLDLAAVLPGGVRVWRNVGAEWQDVTDAAVAADFRPVAIRTDPLEAAAAGDLDRDGDVDLVARTRSGRVWELRNDGGNKLPSVSVRLTGRVSNRSAAGANVEIRAGSLWQRLDLTATSPASAPADLLFGIGRRPRADVVRVLWPSGVMQAEPIDAASGRHATLDLTELDRKPSSCPFLYTWNGSRFEFLTDFLGGGEMGYLHAPGVRSVPDPDEYVRIPGESLVPRDGRLELRVTNELEEATFVDRLQLLAVTHPAGTDVFPAEGLTSPPFRPFGLYVAPALRAPVRALDDRGTDVRDRLRHVDRQFVDGFAVESIRGYARQHALTLDLADPASAFPSAPPDGGRILLVLTGWTDYAFSSDNVAAHQAGLSLLPPSLEVRNARGEWATVIPELGIPVGRPLSVVVDLSGKFLSASREVRIVTTMRVYWDQALVDTSGRARFLTQEDLDSGASLRHGVAATRLEAARADLRWRGFSAEVMPDGREPLSYDYDRVSATSPWKLLTGRYTREGDVRELLRDTDDMFVVSRPGDELQLAFDAAGIPALPAESKRTYLLFAHGYSKEMDLSSASPDHVGPLPFRGMSQYPYAWPERYPDTPAHRDYVERYNTRSVGRGLPALEAPAEAGPTGHEVTRGRQ